MGSTLLVIKRHYVLIGILVAVLIGAVIGIIAFERSYESTFFPNVYLGTEDLGGKNYDEVMKRISMVGDALTNVGVQLVVPTDHTTMTITIPQRTTGLTPDVVVEYFNVGDYAGAVQQAFDYGHSGSWGKRLREQLALLVWPLRVDLPITVREPAVQSLLQRELGSRLKPIKDAEFVRSGTSVAISPETSGETVDIDAVTKAISTTIAAMQTNRLAVTVNPNPASITARKLSSILDFAKQLASQSEAVFNYQGQQAYAGGQTIATWLTLQPGPGTNISIRRDKLEDFIKNTIDGHITDVPVNSRFAMRDGVLAETVPGTVGSGVSIDQTAELLESQLTQQYLNKPQAISIDIPFSPEEPRITSSTISQYNIKDLLGRAVTSFKGSSAARIHNIQTGVDRSTGYLIAPGEEFSLVKAIGEVSEDTGFEKEYVIKNDRSVKEAGGGLCQLATTVFRAILDAGFPITERVNHSYVVGYYGPGLDATIYGPHPDLKFVNDTGNYILFQMKTSGTDLTAEFYGQSDGRTTAVTQPVLKDYIDPPPDKYITDAETPLGQFICVDRPRKGLTSDATSTITYADGHERVYPIHSIYQPWPRICLVGVGFGLAPITDTSTSH